MDKTTRNDKKMRQICSVPINLIFPPVCGICGKIDKNFLCKKCEMKLKSQEYFFIDKYDEEIQNFEEHIYFFKYEGMIRNIILKYKFREKSYLYKSFVNFLLKNEIFFENLEKYDTIVPVPISKKRLKERGYNQSLLLAKELVNQTKMKGIINLKLDNNSIIKTKNIIEQSKLTKEDREQNVQGVYKLNNEQQLLNKRILLIDDIYTTGSTAKECCKILKQAKPKKIGVLTIAKD